MNRIGGRKETAKVVSYRIPELLREEVKELLGLGLIYAVESECAHPVVCFAKKDGMLHVCVDYQTLNAITCVDAFPMTNPQELIYKVGRARYITVVNLKHGFWQVPIDPESQHFTAVVMHEGQYAWHVMPFGLKNAAATFQRMVNRLLSKHQAYATAYLDDIAVFSETWEEHLAHLDTILQLLDEAGLRASPEKCEVTQTRTCCLGVWIPLAGWVWIPRAGPR